MSWKPIAIFTAGLSVGIVLSRLIAPPDSSASVLSGQQSAGLIPPPPSSPDTTPGRLSAAVPAEQNEAATLAPPRPFWLLEEKALRELNLSMGGPDLVFHPSLGPLLGLDSAQTHALHRTFVHLMISFLEKSAARASGKTAGNSSYLMIPRMPEESAALQQSLRTEFAAQIGEERAAALMILLDGAISLHTGDSGKWLRAIRLQAKTRQRDTDPTHLGSIVHTDQPFDFAASDPEDAFENRMLHMRSHSFSFSETPSVMKPFLETSPPRQE